jgi:hypothetical protein
MCGCSKSPVTPGPNIQRQQVNVIPIEDCTYTLDQLRTWYSILVCCKDQVLYPQLGINAQTMNSYLGITGSALNYPTNPCYFKDNLDIIGNFIILITATGKC